MTPKSKRTKRAIRAADDRTKYRNRAISQQIRKVSPQTREPKSTDLPKTAMKVALAQVDEYKASGHFRKPKNERTWSKYGLFQPVEGYRGCGCQWFEFTDYGREIVGLRARVWSGSAGMLNGIKKGDRVNVSVAKSAAAILREQRLYLSSYRPGPRGDLGTFLVSSKTAPDWRVQLAKATSVFTASHYIEFGDVLPQRAFDALIRMDETAFWAVATSRGMDFQRRTDRLVEAVVDED